jgi:iron donor protein CyaY
VIDIVSGHYQPCGCFYNLVMDDQEFRRRVDAAFDELKRSLYAAEGGADFEVEDNAGAIHISFDEPPAKFVISPNAPVRQVWISALSTSFKLDWSDDKNDFVFTKSGEPLKQLVSRLINEQLGGDTVQLE